MDMGIGYIKLPLLFATLFEKLSDEQVGRLVRLMFDFCKTGEEPDFEPTDPMAILWPMCRDSVIDSWESYERQCAARRENGKKGGRPPKRAQYDFFEQEE